eukprot:1300415-Rhodomonas_salina.2
MRELKVVRRECPWFRAEYLLFGGAVVSLPVQIVVKCPNKIKNVRVVGRKVLNSAQAHFKGDLPPAHRSPPPSPHPMCVDAKFVRSDISLLRAQSAEAGSLASERRKNPPQITHGLASEIPMEPNLKPTFHRTFPSPLCRPPPVTYKRRVLRPTKSSHAIMLRSPEPCASSCVHCELKYKKPHSRYKSY